MKEKFPSEENGGICFYAILSKVNHIFTYDQFADAIIYFGQGVWPERPNVHYRDADERKYCTDTCKLIAN